MKLLQKISFALLLLVPVTFFMSCSTEAPQDLLPEGPDPAASVVESQTLYHHDGISSTAWKMVIERLDNGSAIITRTEVPFLEVTNQNTYVALDIDVVDLNGPNHEDVYRNGEDLWLVPFKNLAVEEVGNQGITVICNCQGDGNCSHEMSNHPQGLNVDCVPDPCPTASCGATVRMGRSTYSAAITLKANQLFMR